MYFMAACLIGLRPLLSRVPKWAKKRFTAINASQPNYRPSVFGSSPRSSGRQLGMLRGKVPGYNDLDSLTNIMNCDRDLELGRYKLHTLTTAIGTDESNDNSIGDAHHIRVKTSIEIHR